MLQNVFLKLSWISPEELDIRVAGQCNHSKKPQIIALCIANRGMFLFYPSPLILICDTSKCGKWNLIKFINFRITQALVLPPAPCVMSCSLPSDCCNVNKRIYPENGRLHCWCLYKTWNGNISSLIITAMDL